MCLRRKAGLKSAQGQLLIQDACMHSQEGRWDRKSFKIRTYVHTHTHTHTHRVYKADGSAKASIEDPEAEWHHGQPWARKDEKFERKTVVSMCVCMYLRTCAWHRDHLSMHIQVHA
jgi:hypothetical protein